MTKVQSTRVGEVCKQRTGQSVLSIVYDVLRVVSTSCHKVLPRPVFLLPAFLYLRLSNISLRHRFPFALHPSASLFRRILLHLLPPVYIKILFKLLRIDCFPFSFEAFDNIKPMTNKCLPVCSSTIGMSVLNDGGYSHAPEFLGFTPGIEEAHFIVKIRFVYIIKLQSSN